MSKAANKRRFLKWRKYRQQCALSTRQNVPFTIGMSNAWIRAKYRVVEGRFYTMPHWYMPDMPIGSWDRNWRFDDADELWDESHRTSMDDCSQDRCPIDKSQGRCHLRRGHVGVCDPHGRSHLESGLEDTSTIDVS